MKSPQISLRAFSLELSRQSTPLTTVNKVYSRKFRNRNHFIYPQQAFPKIRKDEIDIRILNNFLDVLKQIEDGDLDQHEGSFKVGTILKEMYIDSALKKADKLNENEVAPVEPKKPLVQMSWKQYKSFVGKEE